MGPLGEGAAGGGGEGLQVGVEFFGVAGLFFADEFFSVESKRG